jgi:hypothetical protein
MLPNRLNILIFSIAATSDLLQTVCILVGRSDSKVKDFKENTVIFYREAERNPICKPPVSLPATTGGKSFHNWKAIGFGVR